MKKAYKKPAALLVDFSLTSSVAGNCAPGSGQGTNGYTPFSEFPACTIIMTEADPEFCTDVPMADNSVFTS